MSIFRPSASNPSVVLNATAATGNVEVVGENHNHGQDVVLRAFNAGPNPVWLNFGQSNAVTATTPGGMYLAVGAVEYLSVIGSGGSTWVAGICAATQTAAVELTPGAMV